MSEQPAQATGGEDQSRDLALDGFRGTALFGILLYHCSLLYRPDWWGELFVMVPLHSAWISVDLFFVLSGYLITGILLRVGKAPGGLVAFYIRRGVRVFPLYYAVLFFFFFVVPQIEFFARWNYFWQQGEVSTWWYWLYLANVKAALVGGWSHMVLAVAWTLAIEEQFYLAWPWIVRSLGAHRLAILCGMLLAAGPFVRGAAVATDVSGASIYVFTFCRLDPLAIGSGIAALAHLRGDLQWLRRPAQLALAIAVAGFVAISLYGVFALHSTIVGLMVTPWMQILGYSCVAFIHGAMLIQIVTDPAGGGWRAVFGSRFLRLLGKYSYSMYLSHLLVSYLGDVVFDYTRYPEWNTIGLVVYTTGVLLGSLAIAKVTWILLEEPCLRLKKLAPYVRS